MILFFAGAYSEGPGLDTLRQYLEETSGFDLGETYGSEVGRPGHTLSLTIPSVGAESDGSLSLSENSAAQ